MEAGPPEGRTNIVRIDLRHERDVARAFDTAQSKYPVLVDQRLDCGRLAKGILRLLYSCSPDYDQSHMRTVRQHDAEHGKRTAAV